MAAWENKIVLIPPVPSEDIELLDHVQAFLNSISLDGWELVQVHQEPDHRRLAVFKRPL